MKSDLDIARSVKLEPIRDIAKKVGIPSDCIEDYGLYKAKLDYRRLGDVMDNGKIGKLILVTSTNPTPAGEGKTTMTIGLADGMNRIGHNTMVALREPSLGPVFGVKGGATGGGLAQVAPMEDINLHFTGDLHAIGVANNLLAALIDNHIHQGNTLRVDTNRVTWRRVVDMNDRQLRYIVDGLGDKKDGITRQDGFDITVASEIMAIFCLSTDIIDLRRRIGQITVAYNLSGEPITANDIGATGAVTALLKDAIRPNLVQTLEGNPVLIHGGPFANIAHGCNSVIATNLALKLSDYVVTEAGFGADLGAEKFLDIKCRILDRFPDAVVLVSTIRSIKYNGGMPVAELGLEDMEALERGISNLVKHIDNIKTVYKLPVVVAINQFPTDTLLEIDMIMNVCNKMNVGVALSKAHSEGGQGAIDLANMVVDLIQSNEKDKSDFNYAYKLDMPIRDKIESVCKSVYGARGVNYSKKAINSIRSCEKQGLVNIPICIAKNQYSLTDDPKKLGRPTDFEMMITDVIACTGAGFLVVMTGDIVRMPGLPKIPAANSIDVDEEGNITGLF